jgi:hypothetical protein
MLKRAASRPPRVFILKPKHVLGAGGDESLSGFAVLVEVRPARVQVVRPRAGRVRMQAAGPRAS